jgi:hypothetical protein
MFFLKTDEIIEYLILYNCEFRDLYKTRNIFKIVWVYEKRGNDAYTVLDGNLLENIDEA